MGRRHPRVEGEAKVTGRARYSYDVRLPGLLYARVLRSPYPHARVGRVDTARALALPGPAFVNVVLEQGTCVNPKLVVNRPIGVTLSSSRSAVLAPGTGRCSR